MNRYIAIFTEDKQCVGQVHTVLPPSLRLVPDVGLDRNRLRVRRLLLDEGDSAVCSVDVEVGDDDFGAFVCEEKGRFEADAAVREPRSTSTHSLSGLEVLTILLL